MPHEAKLILSIPLSVRFPPDHLIWSQTPTGVFTTCSAYQLLANSTMANSASSSNLDPWKKFWRGLWKLQVPNKVKLFSLRAWNKALPTMDNLLRCYIVELDLCNICKTVVEDPLHVILGYPEVEKVWSNHAWFCQAVSSPPADFTNLLSRFLQVSDDNMAEFFICMAWGLWNQQNNLRLGLLSPLLEKIGTQAAKLLQDFINAQDAQSVCSTTTPPNFWRPLSSLDFKTKFDSAVFSSSHSTGIGIVICNGHDEVIVAMAEHIPFPNSVAKVDTMACKQVVQFAFEIGVQEVIFEGDLMIVIQSLTRGAVSEAPYGNLIDNILILASHLSKVNFCHVKRSCNRVADALAKRVKIGVEFQAWIEDLLEDIAPLALFDVH